MEYYGNFRVLPGQSLYHHGILGQKWGKQNGPPYPLKPSMHSAAEKAQARAGPRSGLHLSDKQKKAAKIGLACAGVALAAYGGVYLAKSGKFQELASIGKKAFPDNLGGLTNPGHYQNNCKEVAEATIKRWLGVDPSAIAGEKSVKGNLHDFVALRGYNPKGVFWLGSTGSISPDPSGDSTERVTRQILKRFNEGDCGLIGVQWDVPIDSHTGKLYRVPSSDGHAFNWRISGGKVLFIDDQPDSPVTDAQKYFSMIDQNKEIEIVKLTKEAFQ